MRHLTQLFTRMRGYGARSCIETAHGSVTYDRLLEEIESWRRRLDNHGVTPGSVVALRADFSAPAIAALFAVLARSGIAALIPRAKDVAGCLRDAHATALLEFDAEGEHCWRTLGAPVSHPLLEQLSAANDGGLIIFTSGSTGPPKAALHASERFLGKYANAARRMRTLAFMLFDHVAGLDTLCYTLASGGTLILTQQRDPYSIQQLIASRAVEVLPTSPSFLRALLVLDCAKPADLSSLRVITYGSEAMDPGTLARLNSRFPNVEIIQKYGTTETGAPRTVTRGRDSLWLKIEGDGVQTKVIAGVLWLRSTGTVLGYLNAAQPLDHEGWYCTGDLVDTDGEWIKFRGRVSDVINVGGEKVAPIEVEQTILELEFVQHVAVASQPHALMGHVVTARVAIADDKQDLREAVRQIRRHCQRRLAPHKVPVRIAIDEGIVSERHKVRRTRTDAL